MKSLLLKKSKMAAMALIALASGTAQAQLSLTGSSYTQNFSDLGSGLPTGWSVRTYVTSGDTGTNVSAAFIATPSSATWSGTTGGFKNVASAASYSSYSAGTTALQTADTNRALAVRQVAYTSAAFGGSDSGAAFVLTLAGTAGLTDFDLSFNLQSLDSTISRVTTWKVDYAVGAAPTSFTQATLTGTNTTGGNTFSNNTITVDFGSALDNKSEPVQIRIVALNLTTGSGSRPTTAIDNFSLTWSGSGVASQIDVVSKTPTGSNIPLSTNSLQVKFSQDIAAGTGNISLYEAGTATVVFTAASSAATIGADSTATFSGFSLANNTGYYVHLDSAAFISATTSVPNLAIDDSATWAFSTVDTTPPTPLTGLDETFTECISTALGDFVQYNVTGTKYWGCSSYGHDDSAAVYMNGYVSGTGSETNEDWLITKAPLDLSAMSMPGLSFYQKRRYSGTTQRDVKIATDYVLDTDPNTATWTSLDVSGIASAPDSNVWTSLYADLTQYKATPFYLAFTYVSSSSESTYELTYDDIAIADYDLGILQTRNNALGLKVLGDASNNDIVLSLEGQKAENMDVGIFDMTGRKVYAHTFAVKKGNNVLHIGSNTFNKGMYLIRINNGTQQGMVKAMIQ
ncbi:MAG: choice-of-anchor J domain-containing protein [Edaphocola sp.]